MTRHHPKRSFESEFGRRPEAVWASPGRVNLIGEHTDYNDGFVLPLALQHRVTASAARNETGLVRMVSGQRGRPVEAEVESLAPGAVSGWSAYAAGVLWALQRAGHRLGGVDLLVDGNVPAGAGLSSSAALECAVALAVDDLFGLGIERATLARLAQQAENDFVGMPCGLMDQAASLLCTRGHVLFFDTRDGTTEQVPLDLDGEATGEGLSLLVVDTRTPHKLVDGEYAARRRDCERAAVALGVPALRDVELDGLDSTLDKLDDDVVRRRARHVVTENARVLDTVSLLRAGRTGEIGPLLTASHTSLRDDFEVTVPQLDIAVEAALGAGAYGARMTGGGFGGCIIALVESADTRAVGEAVAEEFRRHGFAAPWSFPTPAAPGAEQLDVSE